MSYEKANVVKVFGKKTFLIRLDKRVETAPGQFFMLRIPRVGEKPFSPCNDDPLEFLVKVRGTFTEKLRGLKPGDSVWLRGPYGNGFPVPDCRDRVLAVSGGTGIAPVLIFAQKYGHVKWLFYGAKTEEELILMDSVKKFSEFSFFSTEDGSFGEKALITEILEEELEKINPSLAVVCGPERMMVKACEMIEKILHPSKIFISVERYVKCGIGLCGSCDFGGYRVCVDGPVFSYEKVKDVRDFGKVKRDECGRRVGYDNTL